jgi:hypothetical protein
LTCDTRPAALADDDRSPGSDIVTITAIRDRIQMMVRSSALSRRRLTIRS